MPEETAHWTEDLPEDLKESSELKNLKSVEDLAKSYVHASKVLSQRYEGVKEDETFDTFATKAQKFLKLEKEEDKYSAVEDKNVNKLGFKYKLHPTLQFKPLMEEFQKLEKSAKEARTQETLNKWKDANEQAYEKIPNKDEILGRAYSKLGTTREKFEENLKDFHNHPEVTKMLLKLGEEKTAPKTPTLTTGEEGKKTALQEKISFVKEQLADHQGPYYNNQHPDYSKVRAKVKAYIPEIRQHEVKTGVGTFKNQFPS